MKSIPRCMSFTLNHHLVHLIILPEKPMSHIWSQLGDIRQISIVFSFYILMIITELKEQLITMCRISPTWLHVSFIGFPDRIISKQNKADSVKSEFRLLGEILNNIDVSKFDLLQWSISFLFNDQIGNHRLLF